MVDAGYPNRPGCLSPYKCTRYHVEQWQNGPPPRVMKETFNHAHARVRNVIERSFGVLKMKFRILLNMPRFPEDKQSRILLLVWPSIISFEIAELQIGNLTPVMRIRTIHLWKMTMIHLGRPMNLSLTT